MSRPRCSSNNTAKESCDAGQSLKSPTIVIGADRRFVRRGNSCFTCIFGKPEANADALEYLFEHAPDMLGKVANVFGERALGTPFGELLAKLPSEHTFLEHHFELRWDVLPSAPDELRLTLLSPRSIREELQARAKQMHENVAIADLSHELRTPLAAIKGYADILAEEYGDNQDLVEISNSIAVATLHMLQLVNEFLDVSKLDAGHERVNISEFDINELFVELSQLGKPSIQRAKNTLSVEPLEQPSNIWTDRSKLRQILLNLLSNAAKFTAHGGISLRAYRAPEDPSMLVLEVEDTGVGIDAETRRKLFSRYGQSSRVQTKIKSSGLGLFLSAQFVKLLDGKIEVESEPGKGSLFRVSLPDVFLPQMESERAHNES